MELRKRKNVRLKDYDYSSNGAYFVTICTQERQRLFGVVGAALAPPAYIIPPGINIHRSDNIRVSDNIHHTNNIPQINLTQYGFTVKTHIELLQTHYNGIFVDKYVIMPNHIHMIVVINAGGASAAPTNACEMNACGTNANDTNAIGIGNATGGASVAPTLGTVIRGFKAGISRECKFTVWQRGYHEHIIRNENEYLLIWNYIDTNLAKWAEDRYYHNLSGD